MRFQEQIIVDFNDNVITENINCDGALAPSGRSRDDALASSGQSLDLKFCSKCKMAKDIEQFRSICNKNKEFNKLCRRCLNIVEKYKINYSLKPNFVK